MAIDPRRSFPPRRRRRATLPLRAWEYSPRRFNSVDAALSTEQSLEYDGPLSTYREWHSLLAGLLVGVVVGWSRSLRSDLRREPHYAVAGLLAGVAIGVTLRPEGRRAP